MKFWGSKKKIFEAKCIDQVYQDMVECLAAGLVDGARVPEREDREAWGAKWGCQCGDYQDVAQHCHPDVTQECHPDTVQQCLTDADGNKIQDEQHKTT